MCRKTYFIFTLNIYKSFIMCAANLVGTEILAKPEGMAKQGAENTLTNQNISKSWKSYLYTEMK